MGTRDSVGKISEDITTLIYAFHKAHCDTTHRVVGGQKAWFKIEFLALLYWVTTYRLLAFGKDRAVKALLDAVNAELFAILVGLGTAESDAEAYVHERYSNYYAAVKSRDDPGQGLSHVAACFVGFCNESGGYSLRFDKNMEVFQLIAAFLHALNKVL